jgi:hypothetical protein
MDSGEAKVESRASPETRPAKPQCFLTHYPVNPVACRTNELEETTTGDLKSAYMHPGRHKESLEHDGTGTSQLAKPSPNPDDAGPIVRRLTGHPVAAGCNTAWDQTQICCDASSTVMQ